MTNSEFDKDRSSDRRRDVFDTVPQILFALASLLTVILTISDRFVFNTIAGEILLVFALGTFYVVGTYSVLKRLRRVRRLSIRLAVTGRPAVGKTVFSILLFDSLMNERLPGVRFAAESRSVIAVYQAIRNIPGDVWPGATSLGNVSTYAGTIQKRRLKVELEVGDSAGEYWLDFGNENERDSGYLEYVISSDCIVHVVELGQLFSSKGPRLLAQDVEDLRLAARLRSQIENRHSMVPLLVVLSKTDLVLPPECLTEPNLGLFKVVSTLGLGELPVVAEIDHAYHDNFLGQLRGLSRQLSQDFDDISFVFSSATVATDRRVTADHDAELLSWLMDLARKQEARRRRFGLSTFVGSSQSRV